MACTTHIGDFALSGAAPAEKGVGAILAKLARRLSDSLGDQRQRDFDREFAKVLARSGGHITDSIEREMMRKVLEPGKVLGG